MGVFLYSNKMIATEKVVAVYESRGHHNIETHSDGLMTLVTAPKIIVNNCNYLDGQNLGGAKNDFAVGVGTFFYKTLYGAEALKKIYEDLDAILIDNLVYGHYAFCIRKNGATYIFNDMSGFLRLYYSEVKNQIVVSSSMLSVLSTIQHPKFDEKRLGGFVVGHYGRESAFVQGLEIFDPLKYLVIGEDGNIKWINKDVPEVPRIETIEDAKKLVKRLFKEQVDNIKPALSNQKICVDATGGLDSRLISSVLKTAGIDFDYINYPIFGPDAEIANILAEKQKKRLLIQSNKPAGDDAKQLYGEFDFGHNYFRQYANPRWIKECQFEFSGARGECIDLPDIYSDEDLSLMNDTRPEVLIDKLLANGKLMTEENFKSFVAYSMEYVNKRCGFKKGEPLSEKQQVEFTQFYAGQYGDSMYNSGSQAHIYFYQLYNEWHFNHFITDIAFDAKKCRKLTIALIKDINPELASFPFVSRRRTRKNSVNEVSELPMQYKSFNGIKKLIPNVVLNYLYKRMGRHFPKERLSAIDMDRYKDVLKVNELKKYPNLHSEILNRLFSVEVLRKKMNIE